MNTFEDAMKKTVAAVTLKMFTNGKMVQAREPGGAEMDDRSQESENGSAAQQRCSAYQVYLIYITLSKR